MKALSIIFAAALSLSAHGNQAFFPLDVEYQACPIAKPFRPFGCPNGYLECICTADGCYWVWRCRG